MKHDPRSHQGPSAAGKAVEHLDLMVREGRLDPDRAAALRSAALSGHLAETAQVVRLDHAGQRVTAAVADGTMTQVEADAILQQMASGEHSPSFRRRVPGILRRGPSA